MVKTILNHLQSSAELDVFLEAAPYARSILKPAANGEQRSFSDIATQLEAAQLWLTAAEVGTGRNEFSAHYRSKDNNEDFASPIEVGWPDLEDAVSNCGISTSQLALYLIHRYDATAERWFLTAEFCELATVGTPVTGGTEYLLTHSGNFVDIRDGGLSATDLNSLGTVAGTRFGVDYFNNIEYSSDGIVFSDLGADNTRACIFSWFEFEMMFKHNCSDRNRDGEQVSLCFTAITSDYSSVPDQSLVTYPHGLTIHTKYYNGDLLNNGDVIVTSYFENMAGDYQTLCPPRCKSYVQPTELVYQ